MNLLSCPNCGSEAKHYPQTSNQSNMISCTECPVCVEHDCMNDSYLEQVWNGLLRTSVKEVNELNEKIKQLTQERDIIIRTNQQLKLDGDRWKGLCKRMNLRMSPSQSTWDIVETCPMFGEEKRISDWQKQIDEFIKGK